MYLNRHSYKSSWYSAATRSSLGGVLSNWSWARELHQQSSAPVDNQATECGGDWWRGYAVRTHHTRVLSCRSGQSLQKRGGVCAVEAARPCASEARTWLAQRWLTISATLKTNSEDDQIPNCERVCFGAKWDSAKLYLIIFNYNTITRQWRSGEGTPAKKKSSVPLTLCFSFPLFLSLCLSCVCIVPQQ